MRNILIIDDEEDFRQEISEILKYEGFNVRQAANGNEGINSVESEEPDLILCDISMPGITGFEVHNKLKSKYGIKPLPFIYITGFSDRGNIRQGMKLGADDYLVKPFNSEELLTVIETQMEKYSALEKFYQEKLSDNKYNLKNHIGLLTGENEKLDKYIDQIINSKEQLEAELKEKDGKLMHEAFKVIELNNKIDDIRKIIKLKLSRDKLSRENKMFLIGLNNRIDKKHILWENLSLFQLKFNQIYPKFIPAITSENPGLSQYDLLFISATLMGFNTFQLAGLLNVSDDSVRKSRYRIKKKLGLSRNDNFYEYIYSFNK